MSNRAARLTRELIDRLESESLEVAIVVDRLRDIELAATKEYGVKQGMMMSVNSPAHDCESNMRGEMEATKKHLEDMRRLVMLENKDGEV